MSSYHCGTADSIKKVPQLCRWFQSAILKGQRYLVKAAMKTSCSSAHSFIPQRTDHQSHGFPHLINVISGVHRQKPQPGNHVRSTPGLQTVMFRCRQQPIWATMEEEKWKKSRKDSSVEFSVGWTWTAESSCRLQTSKSQGKTWRSSFQLSLQKKLSGGAFNGSLKEIPGGTFIGGIQGKLPEEELPGGVSGLHYW